MKEKRSFKSLGSPQWTNFEPFPFRISRGIKHHTPAELTLSVVTDITGFLVTELQIAFPKLRAAALKFAYQ